MSTLSRRTFIQGAAAADAATMPVFSIGKPGPSANGKINVAVVGFGGMGDYAFRRATPGLREVSKGTNPGTKTKR